MQINYKQIILPLLLLIWTVYGWGQTPQESYELFTSESGNDKAYVARDYVSLKPGFSYSATSNTSFNAKIDAGLLFPPTDQTYMTSTGGFTNNPSQGAVVGKIPGTASVTSTGGASYQIPIEVPVGVNGMQPNISLVYNSQTGNGIAGLGWNISGISSINTIPKTVFSDNATTGFNLLDYNYLRKFALDGNSLILESGSTGTKTYITENKSYVKIVNDNTKFIVTTKEGTVMEYAQLVSPQKTSTSQLTPGAIQWLLTKVTDSNGNYMKYSYKSNSSNTQIVLDKIEYTGNGNIVPSVKVQFGYEEKTVKQKQYIEGYYLEDFYLLKNITIYSDLVQLRKYELIHNENNDKYYLTTVTLTGENDEKLKATIIEWGENNTVINTNTTTINNPSSYYSEITRRTFTSGDIDGDGVSDLVEFFHRNDYSYRVDENNYNMTNSADYVKVSKMKLENGNVVFDGTILSKPIGATFSFDDFKSINGGTYLASFNGSQKKTIIVPIYSEYNGNKYVEVKDIKSNVSFSKSLTLSSRVPAFVLGDINNDGIDEMIIIEKMDETTNLPGNLPNGSIVYLKKNDLSTESFSTQDNLIVDLLNFNGSLPEGSGYRYPEIKDVVLYDLNADGLKDIIIFTSKGCFLMKNNGGVKGSDGIVHVSFTQLTGYNAALAMNDGQSVVKSGDVNGDGMLDFLIYNGNNGFTLHLNNGNFGFTIHSISNVSLIEDECDGARENDRNDDKDDFIITDFNHDGKSDLIVVDVNYEKKCSWYLLGACMNPYTSYVNTTIKWYTSNGTTFSQINSQTLNDEKYYYKGYATNGDFDGDGREDLLSYGSNLYTGNNKSDNGYIYTSFNTNFEADRVKSVTDGLGNKVQIAYQPLTHTKLTDGTNFYTREITSIYPVIDVQVPLYCVKNVVNVSGNNTFENTYSYAGAKAHLLGKGFLGFTNQTTNDLVNNIKTESNIEMDFEYCLPLKQTQTVKTLGNDLISTVENQFSNSKSVNVYTSFLSKTIETNGLTGLSKTTEYLTYDDYGNLLKSKSTQGQLITENSSVYGQYGNWAWGNNKPISISTKQTYAGDSRTRQTEYEYDDNTGRLVKETSDPLDNNRVVTDYKEFDIFGHACKVEISANGATRTSTMTYTPSGRFIHTKTDVLGETITYDWDETKGTLNSETLKDELNKWSKTTEYTYDGLGRLKETKYPDGNRKTSVMQWAISGSPAGIIYLNYSQSSGQSPVITWHDGMGREIQKDIFDFNNQRISVSTEYYTTGTNKGKLYRVSEPYFDGETKKWAATYNTYDPYGRGATSIQTPIGTTSTSFNGLSTTITTPEGSKTTTLNNSGMIENVITNGKTVAFDYYASGLTKSSTPEGGQTPLTMEYDLQGNRTKLTDPDAGVVESKYNGFGELISEIQKKSDGTTDWLKTTNNYDNYGILQNIVREDKINNTTETTTYVYDSDLGYKNRIKSIAINGQQHKQSFIYDAFSRVTNVKEEIDGRTYNHGTTYDALGRVKKEIYPSGYYTVNSYDQYGNLTEVKDKADRSIWKVNTKNSLGQATSIFKGAKETTYDYDPVNHQTTSIYTAGVLDYSYGYYTADGTNHANNLEWRSDGAQSEHFIYDTQNRLTNWDVTRNGNTFNNTMSFDDNGNIKQKSDLGNFTLKYGGETEDGTGIPGTKMGVANGTLQGPHALTSISGVPVNPFPQTDLFITYTDFKKVKTLTEGSKYYELTYGVDDQRRKSVYKENGVTKETRYYLGSYEEKINNTTGITEKIHYLSGAIYIERSNGTNNFYYTYADYQGSLLALTDESGSVVERYAFDPWGARRNPDNWTQKDARTSWIVNRGYTSHEHLDAFGTINMNGRVYDPLTAQFFSPDTYVQAPGNWLNYNRYSYCINNPFKYTDPTGEVFGVDDAIVILAMMYMGGVQANFFTADNPMNPADWNWSSGKTYIGIASGAMGGLGMVGIPVLPQVPGILANGALQAGMQVGINGIGNLIDGNNFFQGWYFAAGMGFVSGIIPGYELAKENGLNYWWGSKIAYNRNAWSFFNTDKPDFEIGFNIPNVGSQAENDCVPTTFAEIETKRGGSRTYEDFKNSTNYKDGVGVTTSKDGYDKLVHDSFNNVETLSGRDYHKLFDANYMQNAANNNEVISVHFLGHADNVRSLQVFTRAPYKNTLTFRQGSYNFTSSGKGVKILNIFRFF